MGLQVAELMSGEPEYVSRPCCGTVHHVYVRRSKIRKHGSRGRLQNGFSRKGGRGAVPGSRISAAASAPDGLPPDFGMERALGLLSSR
jgi:hypothetical protein